MNKSSSFLVHLHLLHFVIIKKISIFKRKNLQNHIPKEKSPMNKSSIKISKTSMEKSLRINLQGKISMNKSSLKFFQKFNLQNKSSRKNLQKEKSPFFKGKISKTIFQRKNLHKQIFERKNLHFSKKKSPKPYSKGKISMNKSSKGKISINLHIKF